MAATLDVPWELVMGGKACSLPEQLLIQPRRSNPSLTPLYTLPSSTQLCEAAEKGDTDKIRELLRNGLDVNVMDNVTSSPPDQPSHLTF